MIGLDTNVLVRYLVQDDPVQAKRANSLIDRAALQDSTFQSRYESERGRFGWKSVNSFNDSDSAWRGSMWSVF